VGPLTVKSALSRPRPRATATNPPPPRWQKLRVAVFLDRIVKVMAAQLRKKRERSGKVCSQARAPRHALKRWSPAGCR
jgi:hypothetical protein